MQKRRWLALYTRPRHEKKVSEQLLEENIIFYLPLVKTLRQWTDRKKWVEIPLFSSYVFVYVDDMEYYKALNAVGALRYVSFDGVAVEIPEKQINNIKWVLSTDIFSEPVEGKIPSGTTVNIIKGPLRGLKAEMVNYNNKNIIVLRLDQLDKSFEIKISRNHVAIEE